MDKARRDRSERHRFVNENGQHVVPVPLRERIMSDPNSSYSKDAKVEREVLEALTTRRQQHDMAMRDESPCHDDEVNVCSVSARCTCKKK